MIYQYTTLEQQATERALSKLSQAASFRSEGKPEKWAIDVERKALRAFEHSFSLRHIADSSVWPRPSALPPSSYSSR